jgi:hypothetical protein
VVGGAAELIARTFQELRSRMRGMPWWLQLLVWPFAIGVAILVLPVLIVTRSSLRPPLKVAAVVGLAVLLAILVAASSLGPIIPVASPPSRLSSSPPSTAAVAASGTPVLPSAFLPEVNGYAKTDPIYTDTLGIVAYRGSWPPGVIGTQARVEIAADTVAAAARNDVEAFSVNSGSVDLGGVVAQTGFHRSGLSYAIFFTYGRAAYQLELGFLTSSSTSQRSAAIAAAQSFARSFYANLRASQAPP